MRTRAGLVHASCVLSLFTGMLHAFFHARHHALVHVRLVTYTVDLDEPEAAVLTSAGRKTPTSCSDKRTSQDRLMPQVFCIHMLWLIKRHSFAKQTLCVWRWSQRLVTYPTDNPPAHLPQHPAWRQSSNPFAAP